MNILLCNHGLTGGGSELWTVTMYNALKKLDHNVFVKTFNDNLVPEGFQIDSGMEYDLAIINHFSPEDISAKFKIYTSHGVLPELEKPKPGADIYVAVSEESKNYHNASDVIRNPIDLSLFHYERKISEVPKTILFMSNNPPDKQEILKEAFPDMELIFIGGDNRQSDVRPFIEKADVVVTLGRGVYESMGMNRNVLVFDYKGGEGMITKYSYFDYRSHNCSGRKYHHHWSAKELREIILSNYNPDVNFRPLIEEHHNPEKIAKEYLQLYYNSLSLSHG